jgi:hypothetical protein
MPSLLCPSSIGHRCTPVVGKDLDPLDLAAVEPLTGGESVAIRVRFADRSVALPVPLVPAADPCPAALDAYVADSGVEPRGEIPTLPAMSPHLRQNPLLMLSALRMHCPKSAAGCSSGLRVS